MLIKKFWKSKKFWTALVLIGMGAFIYYFFSDEKIVLNGEEKPSEEQEEEDNNEPYSQIKTLSDKNWHKKDFEIKVLDEDLESGIKEDSCQYKVLSYGPNGEEVSSGWRSRKCNSVQAISVGPEGKCQFEGRKSCWVYVRSQDKAGNWYSPSEEELSIQSYNIDWTDPYVSKVIIEEGHTVKIETTDTFKIAGCLLYIDQESQGPMNFLDPKCYDQCSLEKDFTMPDPGSHEISVYCTDLAGNWGKGEVEQVAVNTPPIINYCKNLPTSSEKGIEIQFTIDVQDIDNDIMSFFWDFGDETFSQEENPTHAYAENGTYRPSVTVSDGKGGEDNCSTAWITIAEQ